MTIGKIEALKTSLLTKKERLFVGFLFYMDRKGRVERGKGGGGVSQEGRRI